MRKHLILISLLSSTLLAGCASVKSMWKGNHRVSGSAEHYLQLASVSRPPQQQQYQLLAVQHLLQDRMTAKAKNLLDRINTQTLAPQLNADKQILTAKFYLLTNQPHYTLSLLNNMQNTDTLNPNNKARRYQLLAQANQVTGNIVSSIEQRTKLGNMLADPSVRAQNNLATWQMLQSVSTDKLSALLKKPTPPTVHGWLQLAYLSEQPTSNSQNFSKKLMAWEANHPNHPANDVLPKIIPDTAINKSDNIALMLPLNGHYASSGKAIRNGFLASYYYARKNGAPASKISIIDTSNGNIQELYQQAIDNGATFIVGPLIKDSVSKLANYGELSVPTLALNTLNGYQDTSVSNLYQFGLSIQDEALQTADKVWKAGHRRALIIAPQGGWGQDIAEAFAQEWQHLGGDVVGTLAFDSDQSFSKPVRDLLDLDQSDARAADLRKNLGEKFRFIPRRRQDVDVVFLVALPQQARQIRPLLKFYYAGDVPVYTTSSVYSGKLSPTKDRDLNGIIFSDMPWILDKSTQLPTNLRAIKQRITRLWPNSFNKNTKLYALGVDAYNLVSHLNQLSTFPQFGIHGATGMLYLDQYNHIYRRLQWAKMRSGRPRLLN